MSYNQMSAEFRMLNDYMPPPPAYGENQKYMPSQISHQQPSIQRQQQQPVMFKQLQHQQSCMLNQPQHQQSHILNKPQHQQSHMLNQSQHQLSLMLNQPQHQQSPMLNQPQHQQSPMLNQPQHQQSPMLNQQQHQQSPMLNQPQHQQSPMLNQPQHQQSPMLNQPQHQQSPMLNQHPQQSLIQNHSFQQQYNTDSYYVPHGPPHPTKHNSIPPQVHALDQSRAYQMHAWPNSKNNILPIPTSSPNSSSANVFPRSSPQQAAQQVIPVPQHCSSNASSMQHTSHPPPLSPMHRLTPQMSPGLQSPASDARSINQARRLLTSSELVQHKSMGLSSPCQSLTGHYVHGTITAHQTHSLHNSTGATALRAHQGFNSSTPQSDTTLLQQSLHYPARGQHINPAFRQSNSPQCSAHLNQIENLTNKLESQHGNRQLSHDGSERQKEMCSENILNVGPPATIIQTSSNIEYQSAKEVCPDNILNVGPSRNLSSQLFSTATTSHNQVTSCERDSGSFNHSALSQTHFSGPVQPGRSFCSQSNDSPVFQNKSPISRGRGSRGGRGTTKSRARGRGNRGRGRSTAIAPQEKNLPHQTLPWCLPSSSSAQSFQSDVEAMQAGFMADATSCQSSHSVGMVEEPQTSQVQQKTSHASLKSTDQISPTSTSNKASDRMAALDIIRIKQEAMESIGKARTVITTPLLDQQQKEGTSRPPLTNKPQTPNSKTNCEKVVVEQTSDSSHCNVDSNFPRANFLISPQSNTCLAQPSQLNNLQRGEERTHGSSKQLNNISKGTQDSLAGLLDQSTSVEKKIPAAKNYQIDKTPQLHSQSPIPLVKSSCTDVGKGLQKNVSIITKSNAKTCPKSQAARPLERQNAPLTETPTDQNRLAQNKRPMTAKERVINMWRDGQVVGRVPTLLKRTAKISDKSQPSQQNAEHPTKSHKTCLSEKITSQHSRRDVQVPMQHNPEQKPKNEQSKSKLDLFYIMFHGHKLICLGSAKEKMLLLSQFQNECFPDKGMGSVNNCIDRSLRIKKKPLQHRLQSDIISYLKKNDYKINSDVLTINLEDARRVYHHMYSIKNCVSVSCVVTLFDQHVDLSHVIPGSKKRIFPREILGRIKTEVSSTDTDLDSTKPNPEQSRLKSEAVNQGKNVASLGTQQIDVGDEDARSDYTLAYDNDIIIVGFEENPNMIRYTSEGPKVGMLCNSLMGSVRSYVHNNEHYLVIEDLTKIFGSTEFNSLLDNQNITVYSCCPEIGAFLNQISNRFPAVTSFHECLVKEKDIGVQWASDQSGPETSENLSSVRLNLKQEIIEDESSCSPSKQPRLSAPSAVPSEKTSSGSDLSESRLQIDLSFLPSGCNKNVFERATTSSANVAPSVKTGNLNTEQRNTESSLPPSPEYHNTKGTSKQPRPSAPHEKNSFGRDLSELSLQIDSSVSPSALARNTTSSTDVAHSTKLKDKTGSFNSEQSGTECAASASPESHSSAGTSASTLVLSGPDSKINQDDSGLDQASLSISSCKDSLNEQHKKARKVNTSNFALDLALKETESITDTTCVALSSAISVSTSHQSQNLSSLVVNDLSFQEAESSYENANRTKTYAEVCQINKTLVGIVQKLRKELNEVKQDLATVKQDLAKTKADKYKVEKVAKHLEDALATMTSSFPLGNSSTPIVIDEDEIRS